VNNTKKLEEALERPQTSPRQLIRQNSYNWPYHTVVKISFKNYWTLRWHFAEFALLKVHSCTVFCFCYMTLHGTQQNAERGGSVGRI